MNVNVYQPVNPIPYPSPCKVQHLIRVTEGGGLFIWWGRKGVVYLWVTETIDLTYKENVCISNTLSKPTQLFISPFRLVDEQVPGES